MSHWCPAHFSFKYIHFQTVIQHSEKGWWPYSKNNLG
jgi:hypothetical protein